MEILFQIQSQWKVDIALVFAWEGEGVDEACYYSQRSAPWLAISPAWRDFGGKKDERVILYGPPAMEISRVMAIGLGKNKAVKSASSDKKNESDKQSGSGTALNAPQYKDFIVLRNAFARALRACRDMGFEHVGIDLVSLTRVGLHLGYTQEEVAREISLAAHLALYSYTKFKEKPKIEVPKIRKMSFLLDDTFCDDTLKNAVRYAEAEASGICLARDLSNAPSNFLTPVHFAEEAERIAKSHGMKCTVLKKEEIEREGMGALIAVGQGSQQESRFAVIEYTPKNVKSSKNTKDGERPVALIGKGVTFDTGGISLKPGAGMGEMKADMSGAGAVLGAFETLGQLAKLGVEPTRGVIGLLPLAENMPDGKAIKPGDIVYSKKGKSIEINNTDAEGRLLLVDALAYAEEKFNPIRMLDIATLTGACVIALGNGSGGLFSTDDALAKHIQNTGERYFERVWHLPLWDDLLDGLKSNVADINNIGPREGGALTAAIFIKQFIDEGRTWVHIDMAAADNADDPVTAKGATGYGVRLLTDFAFLN